MEPLVRVGDFRRRALDAGRVLHILCPRPARA